MINKKQKLLLNEFIKIANKKLDFFANQKMEIKWYDQGNDLYVCDLSHYSFYVEDIANYKEIVLYICGVGVGLNENLITIWKQIVRFDNIVDGNL
jgi:hypothetical protein